MTLKSASLIALVGSLLLTISAAFALVRSLSLLAVGGVAMFSVANSLVYTFFATSLMIFFFVFHRRQT